MITLSEKKILPGKRGNFNILRERIYLMFIRNTKSNISIIGTGKIRRFSGGEKTFDFLLAHLLGCDRAPLLLCIYSRMHTEELVLGAVDTIVFKLCQFTSVESYTPTHTRIYIHIQAENPEF